MLTNIKLIRKTVGYTQEAVANKTGIALGTLRRWEQGINEPDIKSILDLASFYGVTTDTLIGSTHADNIEGIRRRTRFSDCISVPLYGSIAAGAPLEMAEVENTHPVPELITIKYPKAFLLKVEGDSMSKIIPDGCYALIDPAQKEIVDMQPYALSINRRAAIIKRVHLLNNGLELIPDSIDPTYQSEVLDYGAENPEEVAIIGRLVWHTIPFDWEY